MGATGLTGASAFVSTAARSPLRAKTEKRMALYKHGLYLNDSDHGAFDLLLRPDKIAPNSGIYLCELCGAEAVAEKSKLLLVEPVGGLGVAFESKLSPARSPGRELALELDEDA
jgi:hypothetical protein